MRKKPQKTMHVSFDEQTESLFFEIHRKSNRAMVPLAAMSRYYMQVGMEHDKQFAAL